MKKLSIFTMTITALLIFTLAGCGEMFISDANELQLEEHILIQKPELGPLSFQPVNGTQDEVLSNHSDLRTETVSNAVLTIDGNPTLFSQGETTDLVATVTTAQEGDPVQTVRVSQGDKVLFEVSAGLPSPLVPVQAFWTYDGHWALEILFSDQDTWTGRIYIDGKLINDQKDYGEAFGLQILVGKIFFFYNKDGKLGYSYDGKEVALDYDEIPHYYCCAESEFNPYAAKDMVSFFTRQDQSWFYVELGNFPN